jgi:hypothetical protein
MCQCLFQFQNGRHFTICPFWIGDSFPTSLFLSACNLTLHCLDHGNHSMPSQNEQKSDSYWLFSVTQIYWNAPINASLGSQQTSPQASRIHSHKGHHHSLLSEVTDYSPSSQPWTNSCTSCRPQSGDIFQLSWVHYLPTTYWRAKSPSLHQYLLLAGRLLTCSWHLCNHIQTLTQSAAVCLSVLIQNVSWGCIAELLELCVLI